VLPERLHPRHAEADRNLLFGILALQLDFIGRDDLIKAMNSWVLDKAKPLGQILVERGALSIEGRDEVEAIVKSHLKRHGGNLHQSLSAVSAIGSVPDGLREVRDAELQTSLAHVFAARQEEDPGATRPAAAGQPTVPGVRFRILREHARGGLGMV